MVHCIIEDLNLFSQTSFPDFCGILKGCALKIRRVRPTFNITQIAELPITVTLISILFLNKNVLLLGIVHGNILSIFQLGSFNRVDVGAKKEILKEYHQ